TNTSEMVKMIGEANGKKVRLISGFTWVLKMLSHVTGLVNKAFGNFTYDSEITEYKVDYRLKSLAESIMDTEK
ncbi:MAG: NAD-dependent epimerase, partial [Lachnospiraceae bacterium]|nr:NAD-dependent epimerase [Lachnospiraceae bacterium]